LYFSQNIPLIKSRRKAWAGQVTLTERREMLSGFLGGKAEGKRPLEKTGLSWNMFTIDLTFESNSVDAFNSGLEK
jgi:hypothetical protein